jgi:glycosyltransferase involved in cell wall biosynthesis
MQLGRTEVAIGLAVFNGARYLREFLDSLLAQTESNFRLVVSDNASTDETREILEAYSPRFRHPILILPSPARTTSAVLNFARVTNFIEADYLMYADADDVWYSNKVESSLRTIKRHENIYGSDKPILMHSDLEVVDRDLRCIAPSYWRYQNIDPSRIELRQILMRNCVTGCTTILNKALLLIARPIPEEAIMHDHWCALTAAAFGHIVSFRTPLLAYRQHGANDTGASRWGLRFLIRRMLEISSDKSPRKAVDAKVRQAKAFLERNADALSYDQRQILLALATLHSHNALSRRFTLIQHRLFDDGFVRNIGLMLNA